MALNPSARQPRGFVLINGIQVPWEEWKVTNNSYYQPDRYSVELPASLLPAGARASDLSSSDSLEVEIRFALDGSTGTSLIIGLVDDIDWDVVTGMISINGRDYTAPFIENKTAEKFLNQTSSQIATTLAGRHGLTANVTATTTKAGAYYQIDHDKLTDDITEWDLLTYLAQKENYDVWVSGKTLNFQPAANTYGTPIPIVYVPPSATQAASGPFVGLKCKRSMTLAGDVKVVVKTWNHKQKQAFTVQAKAQKVKGRVSNTNPQLYSFTLPGPITKDAAQAWANAKAEEITRHERLISLTMPMDVTTTARSQINLSGTQTEYDQLYWVSEVSREMGFNGDNSMDIEAKNHSPQSIVTA